MLPKIAAFPLRKLTVNLMQSRTQTYLLGAWLLTAAGCCSTRHCEQAGINVSNYWYQSAALTRVLEAASIQTNPVVDMLVLSGGGSHGAWGAGVLRGWRENTEHPRPKKFQVVTGVSTGALLATYAFLGEPADDDLLQTAYTTVATKDIYRKKFLLCALFSDSLYKSSPLKKTIAKYISTNTVVRIAEIGRKEHRRLYDGTVNHDTGKLVIWDLTAIAMDDSNPHRLELYRQVVFASASIPILVPPVTIDGNLYADGGARAQLFFEKDFFTTFRHIQSAHETRPNHPDLVFHIIVNGQLGLEPQCVPDCLKGIAKSTLAMLLDANELGNLYQIEHVRNRIKFGKIWIAPIPGTLKLTPSDEFIPDKMKELYNAGIEFGKSGNWTNSIPGS